MRRTQAGGVQHGLQRCSFSLPRARVIVAAAKQRGRPVEHDLVLSSGFLAFAQHSGFLAAVEEAGIPVGGVMGTSAGALAGSLYAAGYSPREVAAALSEQKPIQLLKPCFEPWRGGLLSLDNVVVRLRELLPATFDGLQRDFAVGVVTADGDHVLIDQGPLPEAVAASAAIPFIFSSVDVPGVHAGLKDGGAVDRIGLSAWRQRRRQQQASRRAAGPPPPCLVHIIERSSPFSGTDDPEAAGEDGITVVRCPKSGVNFFDLGDFSDQYEAARGRALQQLAQHQELLAALPQLTATTHGSSQQQAATNSTPAAQTVVLPGSLGAAAALSASCSSSTAHMSSLVAAATRSSSGGGSGAGSAAASAAPAGLASNRPFAAPSRSSMMRAVQDDSS